MTLVGGSSERDCCTRVNLSTGMSSWKVSCTYDPLLEDCREKNVICSEGLPPACSLPATPTSRYRLVTLELVSLRFCTKHTNKRRDQIYTNKDVHALLFPVIHTVSDTERRKTHTFTYKSSNDLCMY